MKVEIYGNSLGCSSLALFLNKRNWDVTWFLDTTYSIPLRPARLSPQTLSFVKEISRAHHLPLAELHKAPSIKEWQLLESHRVRDLWEGLARQHDTWVDSALILQKFRRAAEESGIRLIDTDIMPRFMGNTSDLSIVDVPREKLRLWSERFFQNPAPTRFRGEVTSIHFPKAPRQKRDRGQIFNFHGISILLESHPLSGVVLSAFHPSRQVLDFQIKKLLNSTSRDADIPLTLRVLATLNPSPAIQKSPTCRGFNGLFAPNVFPIGSGIGDLCPQGNQQMDLSLKHALELGQILATRTGKKKVNVLGLSQSWTHRKSSQFSRHYFLSKLWKNLLLSSRSQKFAINTCTLIPPFLRERLHSPL